MPALFWKGAGIVLSLTINGQMVKVAKGTSLLKACRENGIALPTLCHDERLQPSGGCRLCVVDVQGAGRPQTACTSLVAEGMIVETQTPAIEALRRTLLELLAEGYPADAVERWPDKEFHRLLKRYNVQPTAKHQAATGEVRQSALSSGNLERPPYLDFSHPYIAVDMAKCVHCFRCVRICDEVPGQGVWEVRERGSHTHILPAQGGTLLESGCVSCGACVDTCPTGALEDQSVLERGVPEKWTRTVCPYCGVGCEMFVGTTGGRIVEIKPAIDGPVNHGHLCSKGRYAFEFVHATDRATTPMIRTRDGRWHTVSWPDAIEFTADRLQQIVGEHGADAVGVLGSARGTNEENYLAQKFARVVLGTNNVDSCARVCHQPTATGMATILGTGAATNSFDDIECARSFLIVGCNPTENHPVVGQRIKQAVRRGARLVVIDPRRTELAAMADVHLALRPGTNIPLLNAMTCTILLDRLEDVEMLASRVDDTSEFREFIARWTPDRAAEICGVAADGIRRAARIYGSDKPSMCFHGLGITEHVQGTETVMALVNLALLTGNFGKAGSGINPLRGQNNVQGSAHMGCEPNHLTGYVPLDVRPDRFEKVWGRKMPATAGMNLLEMMDAAEAGRLQALWTIGYDIAQTNPDKASTLRALRNLKLLIVQDLFMNETARAFGTVFLPACSSFEKDGTFMNGERRVQRARRAVPPFGDSRPDWEIICELAKAMNAHDQFAFSSVDGVWDEIRSLWPAGAGITYERLDRGGLQWPCPDIHHPGTKVLHVDSFPAGRKAKLRTVDFRPTGEEVTDEFPLLLTTGRTLHQFNAGTMTRRTPQLHLHSTDFLDVSPVDASRFDLRDGDAVLVRSRYGAAHLVGRVRNEITPGVVFATFHFPETGLNCVTGPRRDGVEDTPEYKVTAVSLEKDNPVQRTKCVEC